MDGQVHLEQPSIPATKKLSVHEQNGVVQPLLTDLYQITMAYAYWKSQKRTDRSVFDLYFRKNPFQGEFTIFAGLEECLKYLKNFKFATDDIEYLQTVLPAHTDPEFYDYLLNLDTATVTLYAIDEGTVVFPKVPLLRLEGPLPIVQLLETTLLTLVNYASLVATNAARFRLAAGDNIMLLEFGLRRAQGPDGGLSASKYCYMGGFDGTSNVLAGKLFGIPIKGTHAHAYVNSFTDLDEINSRVLKHASADEEVDFVSLVDSWLTKLAPLLSCIKTEVHLGEQAAFISYAMAFPTEVLCLVDTYDVKRSGVPNFCAVALALNDLGYRPKGIRLDSGDLAYLSVEVRQTFKLVAQKFDVPWFADLIIVASNDINEETIHSLNNQGHSINCFGIGTHLVTCQKQPALGCVFKLVEINKTPRMKLSEDVEKVTMPGKKDAYRLYGNDGHALVDLLQQPNEPPPKPGNKVLCRHPFVESKRAYVSPAKVEPLLKCYWKEGKICQRLPSMDEIRQRRSNSLQQTRSDHKRALNPTPYKVSVTGKLYNFIHDLWMNDAPIGELS
ncbi:nicotinate phosphoribosyltransferase-like isoform X2 [Lineus longissimus]|uniref:nicotinate phosphoribosyltransferase-like isoform X2 n=1 Tax=Lineus longissimus TaxID=88925 RepID=UPI002B4D6CC6